MGKLRNYFKFEKQKDKTYRVNYRKDGVVHYLTCQNKWEVNKLQKKYKKKVIKKADLSYATFVGGYHSPKELAVDEIKKKKKVTTDEWYKNLNPDDCFVIENHHVRMYSKNGVQKKFMYADKRVNQLEVVKFFLVKPTFKVESLQKHPLVHLAKVKGSKQLRTSQKMLCIMANVQWRDNRPAFDFPHLMFPEIPHYKVDHIWQMGFDFELIRVGDIPKSEVSISIDHTAKGLTKKFRNEKRQETRKKNKILKQSVQMLPPGSVEYDMPKRSKREKRGYDSFTRATDKRVNSVQRRIDKSKK